jgi:hypothetical protein
MIVDISTDGETSLLDPTRFDELKVVMHAPSNDLTRLKSDLAPSIELLDARSAWISSSLIVRLSHLGQDAQWKESWNATVQWALSRGWSSSDGCRIRAHVEWPNQPIDHHQGVGPA